MEASPSADNQTGLNPKLLLGAIGCIVLAGLYQWIGTGWPFGWWAYVFRAGIIAGIFAGGSTAIGCLALYKVFRWQGEPPSFVEKLAVGIYFNGLVLLILGELSLLLPITCLALLAINLGLLGWTLKYNWISTGDLKKTGVAPKGIIPLIFILLPILLFQLVPSQYYDTLEYHLGGPIAWAQNGNTHPLTGNFYTGLPSFYEYIYTWGILIAPQSPVLQAKLLHTVGIIFYLLAAARLFKCVGIEQRFHLPGLAILAAMPGFFQSAYDANNDLVAGGFVALAITKVLERDKKHAYLTGLYLASAMSIKFNVLTVGIAAFLGAFILSSLLRIDNKGPLNFKHIILIPALFLIFVLPVLVRSTIHFGYPMFPLSLIGSPHNPFGWSAIQADAYAAYHFQAWPWSGAYWGRIGEQISRIGSLPIAMLLLTGGGAVIAQKDIRKKILILLGAFIGGLAAWNLLGNSPTRFLLLIQPLIVGAALLSFQRPLELLRTHLDDRKASLAEVALLPTLFILPAIFIYWGEVDRYDVFLAGVHDDPAARSAIASPPGWEDSGLNAAINELLINKTTDPYIFCLYEARVAALPFPAETVTVHDALPPEWSSLTGLRAAGFTHILVNEAELERLRDFYPPDRLRGNRGRPPGSKHRIPGTVDFYADWGPVLLAAQITGAHELPLLITELPNLRATLPPGTFPPITATDHRIWLYQLTDNN